MPSPIQPPRTDLADTIRTDHLPLPPVAGDSELAEAVKVLTRTRKP